MCPSRNERRAAAGFTLFEVLIAVTIMSYIALAMAYMGAAATQSTTYSQGRNTVQQHARVVFERIHRMVQEATMAPDYPGVAVLYDAIGTYRYPDTLIVWHPSGAPANPLGPPLVSECLFYCPDPSNPAQLVELTAPTNASTLTFDPATLNTTAWRATINAIKTASTSQKTLLTELMRTANPTGQSSVRGCVRFELTLNPSTSEIASYKGGSLSWTNIHWPMVMYSNSHGLRQVRLRTELQLTSNPGSGVVDNVGGNALPFFSSTARYQLLVP